MIQLHTLQPFAIGGRRECYVHPDDPTVCIKVHRPEFLPSLLRQQAPRWRSFRKGEIAFDENYSDWMVLRDLAATDDPTIWQHVPHFHGWVETDRGRGLAIELLRDDDGFISRTLLDWIWKNDRCDRLDSAVDAFTAFWESHTIPSRSLGLHNIVVQQKQDGSCRLVIIDGLGNTQFLPFAKWSRRYALRRSASKTSRLRSEIVELLDRRKNNQDPGKRGFLLSRI